MHILHYFMYSRCISQFLDEYSNLKAECKKDVVHDAFDTSCSIHKYGVVRVAPYISMVLSVLLHREVWGCLCCSIHKYGVVRVAP